VPPTGAATNNPATPEQVQRMQQRLRDELNAGGLAVGMGIQYTPGATRWEIIEMFRVAAERSVPVFVHTCGDRVESVGEVIAAAAVTGASLHIMHINSSCLREAPECLQMVAGARGRGLDVTTEAYPYIAGTTQINSALFNPGWREKFEMDYSDLMIPSTGERLTKERFEQLHASPQPQTIIMFNNTQARVDQVIANPLVMIAPTAYLVIRVTRARSVVCCRNTCVNGNPAAFWTPCGRCPICPRCAWSVARRRPARRAVCKSVPMPTL